MQVLSERLQGDEELTAALHGLGCEDIMTMAKLKRMSLHEVKCLSKEDQLIAWCGKACDRLLGPSKGIMHHYEATWWDRLKSIEAFQYLLKEIEKQRAVAPATCPEKFQQVFGVNDILTDIVPYAFCYESFTLFSMDASKLTAGQLETKQILLRNAVFADFVELQRLQDDFVTRLSQGKNLVLQG